MKKPLVLIYKLSAQRKLWSDWADTQADLNLCWADMSFCLFCCAATHFVFSGIISYTEYLFLLCVLTSKYFGPYEKSKTHGKTAVFILKFEVFELQACFCHTIMIEPPHDKTNKMACAPSEDSDQPGHPPSLIESLLCTQLVAKGECPGWSEFSLGEHAILLVLSGGGSCVQKMQMEMANRIDPDQTALSLPHEEQSDLGLVFAQICLSIYIDHYDNSFLLLHFMTLTKHGHSSYTVKQTPGITLGPDCTILSVLLFDLVMVSLWSVLVTKQNYWCRYAVQSDGHQ